MIDFLYTMTIKSCRDLKKKVIQKAYDITDVSIHDGIPKWDCV